MKKLLYTLLVAAMVMGFGATALGAAGDIAPTPFTDIAGHEAEGELTLMAALGIFTGDSGLGGAVKPDDPITRAQFCKVVVLALGKGSTAAGLAGLTPTFTDGASIPSWAWGYVNVASYMNIIHGYPDGSFGANNPVSYAEAVTMLIRAITGHEAQVPPGVWPYNYLFYGVDNGFTGDVDVGFANLPCTRGDMAKLLFATMQVNQLYTSGTNAGTEKDDSAILAGRLFEGVYDGANVGAHAVALGDPVYLVGAKDYNGLLGLNVIAVTKAGKDIFLWKTEGEAIQGVFAAQYTDTAGNKFLKLADGTKVPIGDFGDCDVVLNGETGHDDTELIAGDEVTITVNDDGDAVSAVALRWDLVDWTGGGDYGWDYLKSVTKSTSTLNTKIEFYSYVSGTVEVPKTAKVYINGKLAGRDDLAAYDVVKGATFGAAGYSGADDLIALSATRNKVEGTVLSYRTAYPGPHYFVTLKSGDVTKEYEIDATYGYAATSPTGVHKYGLDEKGLIFVDEQYEPGYPFVIVTGAETQYGTTTKYFVTVDNKGQTQTYDCTDYGSADGLVGEAVVLEVDGATGAVTDINGAGDDGGATIVAIGSDSVTIDWGSSTYDFLKTSLAYSDETGLGGTALLADAEFIGLAGLKVGDTVEVYSYWYADVDGDTLADWPDEYIFLLVRDDS